MAVENKLQKIYEEYFDLIDSYFGGIKKYLDFSDDFPHIKLANQIASYDLIADLIVDATDDLGDAIKKFWDKNQEVVKKYLVDSKNLKCEYSGDLSPVDLENFLKRSILYVDTVILPDPILNICVHTKQIIFDKRYYLRSLIRHVFNVWRIKNLVLTNTEPRVLIIYPISIFALEEKQRNNLLECANQDYYSYHSNLFDKNFSESGSFEDFLEKYPTAEKLFKQIKHTDLLPLKFRDEGNFIKEFKFEYSDIRKKIIKEAQTSFESQNFAVYSNYQIKRAQEQFFFCNQFSAEPIADYEVAWSFNNYVIGGAGVDSAVLNSLQKSEFDWIGNVPLSVLGKLRDRGTLDYMRETLRKGIRNIHTKNDKDLEKTIKTVQGNLIDAFKRQKEEEKKITKEVIDIYKKEIPIAIGGNLIGLIPIIGNVVSFISSTIEVGKKYLKASKEKEFEKRNPINLLIDAYEKK